MSDLDALDPLVVEQHLSRLPFVKIDGVINVRDLGLLPSQLYPNLITKPRLLYRSAELSGITDEGKAQLRSLGISHVFDLRSDTEIVKYNTPVPTIDGVSVNHIPVFRTEDYSPEMMAKRYQLYASGKTEAFMELYSQILDHGGTAFGAILRHVRDRPNEGCVFHCTAGKDRTGVIAAILLKLAGVDNDRIAHDYALTRIGREPARAKIIERLSKEPLFASNNEAALNMFTCRHETMMAFLDMVDSRYSGVEGYVKRFIGLTDDDIATIRQNILVLATEETPALRSMV
ncbi:TYR-PHOSPHATASE-2 domain-containing protein [Mycena indigotica]|uniref:TYR-PHOSPHATASE-2 domain-containing protein n=1 Tax=Mycena indigotica TaxID=2126181 RepID=A0A8H6W1X1_9AGAR|nr:TYR-PHOSPHATASE-2 domain-containing protein [Mycena indigotica]KAF7301982.1 TYR-PHOSPHATASE-2 domain-containing protein [Mycena indigotica]